MSARNYRVLLIEDSPSEARLIQIMLREAHNVSFQAETVDRLSAGMERLEAGGIDVVLLDLSLPDSHGLETFERLYAQYADIPIVVLSGLDDEAIVLRAVQLGAQDYLVKDGNLSIVLVRSLRYAVERYRASERLRESEQHLRLLNEQLPAYHWTTDLDLKVITASTSGVPGLEADATGWIGVDLNERRANHTERLIDAHLEAAAGRSVAFDYRTNGHVFRTQVEPFRRRDGQVIGTIGLALDVTDQVLVELELQVTRQIQEELRPTRAPALPGLDIAGKSHACAAAGGDFFDYVSFRDGSLGVVICDVGGSGLGPSLLMAQTRAYLRALCQSHNDPASVLNETNRFLCSDTSEQRLVALFLAKIEPDAQQIQYAAAGHRSYLLRPDGKRIELTPSGIPLNISPDETYATAPPISVQNGDVMAFFTDGIVDCSRPDNETFGVKRMLDKIKANRNRLAKDIVHDLFQEVRNFAAGSTHDDDMTSVVVRFLDASVEPQSDNENPRRDEARVSSTQM